MTTDKAINERLKFANIKFHLTEVKGPVMDKFQKSHLLYDLTGDPHISQHKAIITIYGNSYDMGMEYHL